MKALCNKCKSSNVECIMNVEGFPVCEKCEK